MGSVALRGTQDSPGPGGPPLVRLGRKQVDLLRATSQHQITILLLCGTYCLQVLMGSLALRRTKDSPGPDGRPLVKLPSKTVQIVGLELGPEDALNYARLEAETKSLVGCGRVGSVKNL